MALAAIALTTRLNLRWDGVGTWIGGLGSFAAAFTALWIAVTDNRKLRLATESKTRQEQRASLLRAGAVTVDVTCEASFPCEYRFTLTNHTDSTLYEVTWTPAIVITYEDVYDQEERPAVHDVRWAPWPQFHGAPFEGRFAYEVQPHALKPGQSSIVKGRLYGLSADVPNNRWPNFAEYPAVAFTDTQGYSIGRDFVGAEDVPATEQRKVMGKWVIADDNYPESNHPC